MSTYRHAWLLILCLTAVSIEGCGLGWLYMRIGDSHRIRATKLLARDTAPDRFEKAQAAYEKAIEYYRDSLVYDDRGNPSVYHKAGFTYLQLDPPQLDKAKKIFEKGIEIKTDIAEKEGRRDRIDETLDEDYSRYKAGLGTVLFLTGIRTKDASLLDKALSEYTIADNTAKGSSLGAGGMFDSLLDRFNLREILTPVPVKVLMARVYLYRARKNIERGQSSLAQNDLKLAIEAAEETLEDSPEDSRALAELARAKFLQKDYKKALEYVESAEEREDYAARVENQILHAQCMLKLDKADEALAIFQDILTADSTNVKARVGRAHAYARKGDQQAATADVEEFLRLDSKDPRLYLEAGRIFLTLKRYDLAVNRLLKGYYIDPSDIELNYYLGLAYEGIGKVPEMKDCFSRVLNLDPTSTFSDKVKERK